MLLTSFCFMLLAGIRGGLMNRPAAAPPPPQAAFQQTQPAPPQAFVTQQYPAAAPTPSTGQDYGGKSGSLCLQFTAYCYTQV